MRPTQTNHRFSAVLVALFAVLPCAMPGALGQSALGDGRQLDNSLSTQTRYNAQRVNPRAEYQFRNAVATGNAPGGMSLRADVGYRSAREFRGDLGSDDLFSFRRDSIFSGLAGMGIRGTDAIQYQFALTTGTDLPQNIVGSAMVLRGGAALGTHAGGGAASTLRQPTMDEIVESQRITGMLRSPSSYATTRSLRPVLLGNVASLSGEVKEQGVSASSLRGIRIVELRSTGSEQAENQRVRTAYDMILDSQRIRREIVTSAGQPSDEDGLIEAPEDWRARLNTLRNTLLMGEEPEKPTPPEGETPEGPSDEQPVNPMMPAAPGEIRPGLRFDPETLEILRPDGEVIGELVSPESAMDSVYVSHMEAGQHLLSVGRYFDAEERFTRALSVRSGDVAAQVGRLHSQLGAGLFVSAGLNLRELMMTSPEIAATRFAPGLLPGDERAAELVILLSERSGLVEGHEGNDLMLARETALLLAYLSYQRGDNETVSAGLAAAEGTLTENEREVVGPDVRLIAYLTQLWIPSGSAEPEGE